MYGLAMPILFPIALFAFINIYVTERFMFAYFYRQPPMYANRLNDGALNVLKWAPILLLAFGYWQLGNRQIFFNEIEKLERLNQMRDPKHYLFDYS